MTNYVRQENMFQCQDIIKCEPSDLLGLIINPNNINMNIFQLEFPSAAKPKLCVFYEGAKVGNDTKLVSEIKPIAHNRSIGKPKATLKLYRGGSFSYTEKMFDFEEYFKLSKLSYNETGWVLNKNKEYILLYLNPTASVWESSFSILWNEYS